MSIDTAAVRRVARLARLEIPENELERYAGQFTSILAFVEQVNTVDTTGVEPLSNVSEITLSLRPDKVTEGNQINDILANAPETLEGFFVVQKVVE